MFCACLCLSSKAHIEGRGTTCLALGLFLRYSQPGDELAECAHYLELIACLAFVFLPQIGHEGEEESDIFTIREVSFQPPGEADWKDTNYTLNTDSLDWVGAAKGHRGHSAHLTCLSLCSWAGN